MKTFRGAGGVATDSVVTRGDKDGDATDSHLLELGVDALDGLVVVVTTILSETDAVDEGRLVLAVDEGDVVEEGIEDAHAELRRVVAGVDEGSDGHDVLHIEVGLHTDLQVGVVDTIDLLDVVSNEVGGIGGKEGLEISG